MVSVKMALVKFGSSENGSNENGPNENENEMKMGTRVIKLIGANQSKFLIGRRCYITA